VKIDRGTVVLVELDPKLDPTLGGSGLAKTSYALTDQVRSVDKRRIRKVFGPVTRGELAAIDLGLELFLGLGER
jgi:mRNA-degrading endonuclease toxin of MazEF toxin-antitoxin module